MFSHLLSTVPPSEILMNPALLLPIILGGISIYLFQLGMGQKSLKLPLVAAGVILMGVVIINFIKGPATLGQSVLISFGILCVFGSLGLLSFREPVHAGLGFALAVISAGGIFLVQSAPFIAASTVIVYAGATIIIFLFVMMFAQSTQSQVQDTLLTAPLVSVMTGTIIMWMLLAAISTIPVSPSNPVPPARVVDLGREMYTTYLYAVEIAGTLLLIATIGAIVIGQKKPLISATQISETEPPSSRVSAKS